MEIPTDLTFKVPTNIKIVPKPRFFVIVACIVFGTILLWDQAALIQAVQHTSSQVCRPLVIDNNQWPDTKIIPQAIEPPKVVVPYTTPIAPSTLVKVRDLRKFYLAANQEDGLIVLRTGGTVPWRLNNPGMITQGDFAREMGSIGSDGKNAIFPSYDVGRKAMATYLFTGAASFHKKALNDIFPSDTLKFILHETNIPGDTVLDAMSSEQKDKLLDAIQKSNGFIEGKVTRFKNDNDFTKNGW